MRKNDYQMLYFLLLMLILVVMNSLLTGCKGRRGKDAVAPVVTTVPAPASLCPTGGSLVSIGNATYTVCNGIAGVTGQTGATGASGASGIDATPVTVVDLCPGTSAYPGVFVEVALCLQGQLYGVYSANGGFLTLLPPGNYTSNGIGSACNLTVSANCVVSH